MTSKQQLVLNRSLQYGKNSSFPTSLTWSFFNEHADNVRSPGLAVPEFRRVIALGDNATTPLDGVKYRIIDRQPGVTTLVLDKFPYGSESDPYREVHTGYAPALQFVPYHPTEPADFQKSVASLAYSRFASSVREAQESISGPTFLGELKETISMFRKPMKTFNRFIEKWGKRVTSHKGFSARRISRNFVREQPSIAADFEKVITDSWLELSFGIKPLIGDVRGIAEGLARLLHEVRHSVVRGFAEDSFRTVQSSNGNILNTVVSASQHCTTTVQVIFRGGLDGVLLDAPFNLVDKVSRIFGFNSNFAPTIWELLPGSFLIDYISNVGDIIAAEATDFSHVKWACRTDRRVSLWNCNATSSMHPSVLPYGRMPSNSFGSTILEVTSFSRSIVDARQSEMRFEWSLPRSTNPYLNTIALLRSWTR